MIPSIGKAIVPNIRPAFANAHGMASIPVPMLPLSNCIRVSELDVWASLAVGSVRTDVDDEDSEVDDEESNGRLGESIEHI